MSAPNAGHAFATVLVDELVRGGVRHACIAPGSRSAPLAYAFAADERITLHVHVDERSASFLALGIAKATRTPVAMVCTSGTAAAELHPAILEAHHARVPLIALTADRPPELRATGAGQTIDQTKLYGDAVRFFADAGVPEARDGAVRYWRSLAARAVAASLGAPPGPVHLNVPLRDPLTPEPDDAGFPFPLDGRAGGAPWVTVDRSPRAPSEETVGSLAAEVAIAERGLIVCGETDADPVAVHALARACGYPVIAEPQSGVRNGDLVVTTYEALLRHEAFVRAHAPDLVIRIGRVATSRPLLALLSPGVRQVLVDPDAAWIDPERSVARAVDADPSLLCAELDKAVRARGESRWMRAWLDAERHARAVVDDVLDAMGEHFEGRVARDVADALPDGSTLVVASSMPVRDLDYFMRPRNGVRVLSNRGANGIDGFVSAAIGVGIANAGRSTVALAGDLSMLHDANGLLLPRDDRPDVVFVVVNNDGGGIFSFLPHARFPSEFERLFGTPHGCDFAALAQLHGCGYALAEGPGDLIPALNAGLGLPGITIVEVRTDRAANVETHRAIWDAVARAI